MVRGKIVIKGPAADGLRVHIVLAERGVLYPGKGKVVVHRMVARGVMTRSIEGTEYKPENGEMTIVFERSLQKLQKTNEAWLAKYEKRTNKSTTRLSTRIDPRQVSIVAFVRAEDSNEVMQAVHIDAVANSKTGGPR